MNESQRKFINSKIESCRETIVEALESKDFDGTYKALSVTLENLKAIKRELRVCK